MPPSSYHLLTFPDLTTTAAFIAAASRVLDSPRMAERDAVEIWVSAAASEAYLTDAALGMVAEVFAPLPPVSRVERTAMPEDTKLVVDATTRAMGLLEAERRLTL